jgi:hypothetical protein
MTLNFGKLLFPRLSPDQRRREIRFLLTALFAGVTIAGVIAWAMLMLARSHLR